MNLYHLRVFLTVAEHEHITRASEELILSQPAVTKIIQHLEQESALISISRGQHRLSARFCSTSTMAILQMPTQRRNV